MKITGIIAEYNPFHKGHLYQLKKIKKAFPETAIVIVMSGSFTQRGEVTILDKWCRARLAIEYGADLVLELPFVYAVRSAQDFASGAVRLLSYLGVQVLAFGAETDSLQICQEIALLQETKETQTILHQKIATGSSYAAALTQAILISSIHSSISSFLNSKTEQEITDLLHAPNTILAIEYLRAIQRYANQIKPFLIPRIGSEYHSNKLTIDQFPSASGIREELLKKSLIDWGLLKKTLPAKTFSALHSASQRHQLPSSTFLFRPFCEALLRLSFTQFQDIYGINEGIENRLIKALHSASSMEDLIDFLSTKRYPKSRISRLLVYLMLQITKEDMKTFDDVGPLYLRPLAFNERGQLILHQAKVSGTLPIIAHLPDILNTKERRKPWEKLSPLKKMISYDTWATDLRNLSLPSLQQKNADFLQSPYFKSYPS